MRAYLEIDGQPGTYDFDRLDGYDSPGEKNSLNHHPDLQEKVRNAIIQGRIDPEDFNGVSPFLWSCFLASERSFLSGLE